MVNNKDKHKDNDKGNFEYKDKDNDEDCLWSCVMVGWSKEERETSSPGRPGLGRRCKWVRICSFIIFYPPNPPKKTVKPGILLKYCLD